MTYTSSRPFAVDGVRLDTLAWGIEKINRATAGRRSGDVAVPGRDGVVASLNDDLEPLAFGLEMFVMGSDADGAVPAAGRRDTMRANLDSLVHLFGKSHALLEVTEQVDASTTRRALAKVTDAITPDLASHGGHGRFVVALTIPSGTWEDATAADWTSAAITPGEAQEVTSLQGGTIRTQDAIVLVQGPVTNPRLTDPATGAYVELQAALSASQFWRLNMGTWASRYGAGLGLGSADTTGTDGQALTRHGGTLNQAAFLPLTPTRTVADPTRRVHLALTGSGITAGTRVSLRARRKYAL